MADTSTANVVSKIASADFPDDWPELFPRLVSVLGSQASGAAVLGSLRVLYELVDSGLSDEQFFGVARDLVSALQRVVIDSGHDAVVQAMGLRVLGGCFDNLEQVLQTEHASAVKAFLSESIQSWMPYFIRCLKSSLPEVSASDFDTSANEVVNRWKGVIAVKIQVIQVNQLQVLFD